MFVVPVSWLPMLRELSGLDDAGLRAQGITWEKPWPRGWDPERKFRIPMQ